MEDLNRYCCPKMVELIRNYKLGDKPINIYRDVWLDTVDNKIVIEDDDKVYIFDNVEEAIYKYNDLMLDLLGVKVYF